MTFFRRSGGRKAAPRPLLFNGQVPMMLVTANGRHIQSFAPEGLLAKFSADERASLAQYGRVHVEGGVWVDMVVAATKVAGR